MAEGEHLGGSDIIDQAIFIQAVATLHLPDRQDIFQTARTPLTEEDRNSLPEEIESMLPPQADIAVFRSPDISKITLVGPNDIPDFGISATGESGLYPIFFEAPRIETFPDAYNPDTSEGKRNLAKLALAYLKIAKRKFGRKT